MDFLARTGHRVPCRGTLRGQMSWHSLHAAERAGSRPRDSPLPTPCPPPPPPPPTLRAPAPTDSVISLPYALALAPTSLPTRARPTDRALIWEVAYGPSLAAASCSAVARGSALHRIPTPSTGARTRRAGKRDRGFTLNCERPSSTARAFLPRGRVSERLRPFQFRGGAERMR